MEKINLKKTFGRIGGFFSRKHSKSSGSARNDWKIIIIFFFILNVISFGLNIYMWFRINQGDIFTASKSRVQSQPVINKKDLDEVLKHFETKKQRTTEGLGQANPIVDPSR